MSSNGKDREVKALFGYIRAAKPELKVKEYEMYKAVYCSLCRELGRQYGFLTRFTLSYDFTFLALLNMSLSEGCEGIERKHCVCNPLKKCAYCKETGTLAMPCAAAMIMAYYKLKDNIADEKGLKRLGYRFLAFLFHRAKRKAASVFPQVETVVSEYMREQNALEQADCREPDAAADPTAKALSRLFMLCSEDPVQQRILNRMGYCVGRYIYLLDAACDLPDDLKRGSYNVLSSGVDGDPAEYAKRWAEPRLTFCINEATRAFELLELKKYKPILGNILYLGLEDTLKKELTV